MTEIRHADPVLCYIDGDWAFFTTRQLDKQWGDDWNDAPYEHNAGWPYDYHEYNRKEGVEPWTITRVAFKAPLERPCDGGGCNSRWSVEDINAGRIAWLAPDSCGSPIAHIWAGTPLSEFRQRITAIGGEVFEKTEGT